MASSVLRRARERGASVVEFAVIFPILALLIIGIVEFGHVFETFLVVNSAAREGARVAARGGDLTMVQDRVLGYLTDGLGTRLNTGDVTFSKGWVVVTRPEGIGTGKPVIVQVPTVVKTITPLLGQNFQIGASARMRQE